jgi:hypothetical protein
VWYAALTATHGACCRRASDGDRGEEKAKGCSFLKKRTKRLLLLIRRSQDPGHGRYAYAGARAKLFCFFSSEKKYLA